MGRAYNAFLPVREANGEGDHEVVEAAAQRADVVSPPPSRPLRVRATSPLLRNREEKRVTPRNGSGTTRRCSLTPAVPHPPLRLT
ncbi:hypothetical protein D3C71_800790 [compost metagenome]